jgi:peroxiredoxin
MNLNRSHVPNFVFALALVALSACAHSSPAVPTSAIELVGTDGRTRRFEELTQNNAATVLVFFSATCPCMRVHDERLKTLAKHFSERGVQVYVVDSEYSATVERDAHEAESRGYPFPILLDAHSQLMEALGAQYATYSVVLDATGHVRYRGGFDSDKNQLHDDARPYLMNAVEDVASGREPKTSETKALGCSLQRW